MTKTNFMDKYPVYSLKIEKDKTSYKNINEILNYIKSKIDGHNIATYIAMFDNFSHTKSIEGEIEPLILDAQNIIFCFGAAIPNSKILAVRPRSIGVVEQKDNFLIECMEAPSAKLHLVMEEWIHSIENR